MMQVWNGIERYPDDGRPCVATIGNYDGVHLGHQAILRSVVERARASDRRSLLVTFDPHPLEIVAPDRRPRLLQTRRQKLEGLEGCGLDAVLVLRFDASLAALSGEAFFERILCPPLRLDAVHVGENFRFGHGRHGDVRLLQAIGREGDFDVVAVPPVEVHGRVVSSSAIRRSIEQGDVESARRMLGRPFSVLGEVVRGDGRGREMRFPTANLDVENEMVPGRGVYVTEAVVLATRHPSVSNVGLRPTFGGMALVVETHLLDFDEDLYGEHLQLRFLARLRDERKFSGADELADQIARDRAAAVAYFQNFRLAAP